MGKEEGTGAPCIFCRIAAKEAPSFFLWEDESFAAFLDIRPVNPGHVLLVPKSHASSVFDLEGDAYGALFRTARLLAPALKEAAQSKRVGLAVEGFGVDHAHVHLVPINAMGELDPGRARETSPEELRAMADRIREQLDYQQSAQPHNAHPHYLRIRSD